jgi:hypothetical protein
MSTDEASPEGKYEYQHAVLLEPPEIVEYMDPDSTSKEAILFQVYYDTTYKSLLKCDPCEKLL